MRFSYIKNIVVFDSDAGTLYPIAWDPFNFLLPCSPVKRPLILYGSIIRVSPQRQMHTRQNYVILTPGVAFVLLQLRLLCATFVCFVWFASILFGLCLLRVPFALCDLRLLLGSCIHFAWVFVHFVWVAFALCCDDSEKELLEWSHQRIKCSQKIVPRLTWPIWYTCWTARHARPLTPLLHIIIIMHECINAPKTPVHWKS